MSVNRVLVKNNAKSSLWFRYRSAMFELTAGLKAHDHNPIWSIVVFCVQTEASSSVSEHRAKFTRPSGTSTASLDSGTYAQSSGFLNKTTSINSFTHTKYLQPQISDPSVVSKDTSGYFIISLWMSTLSVSPGCAKLANAAVIVKPCWSFRLGSFKCYNSNTHLCCQ